MGANGCEYEIETIYSRYIDYIYAEGKIVALHVHNTTANADSIYYVQTDLLGSRERIVDGNRYVVQSCLFDPWGNRMSASDWTVNQDGSNFAFRRGFTGHEHYDRFGIILDPADVRIVPLVWICNPDPWSIRINYSIYQYKIRSNWRTGTKGSLFAPKLNTLGYDSDCNAAQVRLAVSKNQKTIQ